MEKILKTLGCEVRGIDLKTENRLESIYFFKYCNFKSINYSSIMSR